MSPERLAEFYARMQELIAEYWGDPDRPVDEDPEEDVMAMAAVMFRFPGNG